MTESALARDRASRMRYDNRIDAYPPLMARLDIHTMRVGGGWCGKGRAAVV